MKITNYNTFLAAANQFAPTLMKYAMILLILANCVLSVTCSVYLMNMNQETGRKQYRSQNIETKKPETENSTEPKIDSSRIMRQEYISKYKDLAISEMIQYHIPASITLAQGLLESDVGRSRLATEANNHFGIKCFSKKCTKGHCINFPDDSHKDFFRKYDTVGESYKAHSIFLQKDRYRHLQEYEKDYKKWARGLSKSGYATDKKYPEKLIRIIESYNLTQYDK